MYNPSSNTYQYYVNEIKRLQEALDKEKRKPFWHLEKYNNIGFWNGCIVQMKSTAEDLLTWDDYQKIRDL